MPVYVITSGSYSSYEINILLYHSEEQDIHRLRLEWLAATFPEERDEIRLESLNDTIDGYFGAFLLWLEQKKGFEEVEYTECNFDDDWEIVKVWKKARKRSAEEK